MNKIYFIILLYLFSAKYSYSQRQTVINGKVSNIADTIITINLKIIDGAFATATMREYSLKTKDGNFHFNFPLEKTSTASLDINNQLVFVPGSFSIVINPGDSLNFKIPNLKSLGLVNLEISGKGSKKLLLMQKTMQNIVATGLSKKPWNKMTITEKFLKADRYLSIIDSLFIINKLKNSNDFHLIRSQLVDQTLDMLLNHSVQHYSDSVDQLFNKFIVNKKRIEPLLNEYSIKYFGGNLVLPNYIYLRYMKQISRRLQKFRFQNPLEYSDLIVREFNHHPEVKDYMLSNFLMDFFSEKWDSSDSATLYKFYQANVNKSSPYYQSVKSEYEHVSNLLKAGKPFYEFNLPDTAGQRHSLTDFRGKVVVIDFWFTGCSGCKMIAPFLTKAEEALVKDKVQFMSVNVDRKPVWKIGIGIYSSQKSLQLYTEEQRFDHPIIHFAKVSAYPRLLVLDKLGNIVGTPPDPRADLDGFLAYIQKAL